MNARALFDSLLQADDESDVTGILAKAGYANDDPGIWLPLGQMENNFGAIGNQQADASGALVEKIINSIDAVLMAECFKRRIDPESKAAPPSMSNAVQEFFGIRDGKLENLTATEQTKLAERIHLVAVGSKGQPSYLIIDDGEGQSPRKFGDTFLSLMRSNKMRIPFVQGKFNAGGTGILQFCGTENYQLIASRRNPVASPDGSDPTASDWGFTLVRRMPPAGNRRSSSYVYLAPGRTIPSFKAASIPVLPSAAQGPGRPPKPYSRGLEYGTCVKLYNYRWRARSVATTEARYELERFLYAPCLPFRVTETRDYRANFYSTTVTGVVVSIAASKSGHGDTKVEEGFPSSGEINLPETGRLPYSVVVFTEEIGERHVPKGVHFTVNGQVHGSLAPDFVSRKLKFDYLRDYLLVSVDCTNMDSRAREDLFMASRDRIRHNEVTEAIGLMLERELRDHAGLKALNNQRRAKHMEESLKDDKEAADVLQQLLHLDPALAGLLGMGDKLVSKTGPGPSAPFKGRRFPTFFKLEKESEKKPYVKDCAINRSCRVDFVTDATNDYFSRGEAPGVLTLIPGDLCEHVNLWNGEFGTKWRPPAGAKVGDLVDITVAVTDEHQQANGGAFNNKFKIRVAPPDNGSGPGGKPKDKGPNPTGKHLTPQLAMPHIKDVTEPEWQKEGFDQFTGLRIRNAAEGEGYDFYLNVDNAHVKEQLKRAPQSDHPLVRYWFKYGLALCTLGIVQEDKRRLAAKAKHEGEPAGEPDLDAIGRETDGIARVIVPVIRALYRGPQF